MKSLRALPMAMTISRLALGPAFCVLFMQPFEDSGRIIILLLIIAVAIVTDWLDGVLARRWHAVSLAGKLLDPFTDALFCMMVFLVFARHGLMPYWIVWILIGREALVTFLWGSLALWRGVVISARTLGKYKTAFQFGLMVAILVWKIPGVPLESVVHFLVQLGLYTVLMLSLTSAAYYIGDLLAAMKGHRSSEAKGQSC